MDEKLLDAAKIPKFQFEIHNQQLTNCIKELYFQFKTQEKRLEKLKRDIDLKINQSMLSDLFIELTTGIDLHPTLLKELSNRSEPRYDENQLKNNANRFGSKMGQMSEVMRLLYDKLRNVEKRLQFSETEVKQQINEKTQALQNQLDESKRSQNKENRSLNESIILTHGKYEQKLKEVESKTIWQINDCKTRLNDRVNEQFVKDHMKQGELKIMNKIKESMIKSSIDPVLIDNLQSKCTKLEKELEIKVVELAARINQIKDNIELSVPNRKEISQEKLENEKKTGNLQIAIAEANRKIKSLEQDSKATIEDLKASVAKQEASSIEIGKIGKLVSNLRISDDFQKLMENLDPHKICELDTSINALNEKDLKIEKEIDTLKRYIQKFREKVEICNLLTPGEQNAKLDKEQINKLLTQLISTNSTFKKISTIQGQLHEFRAHSDMINDINKRISKIQKDFDLQTVIYGLRGLEEFIKKQLLIMNTKLTQFQGQINEEKRRRPVSAKRSSQTKISSSVSFKRLVPVDCISCFQNPIGERTPERASFMGKRT